MYYRVFDERFLDIEIEYSKKLITFLDPSLVLGDEYSGHGLIQRGPIHVNCGPNRENKPRDSGIDVTVLLQITDCNRQCSRTNKEISHFPLTGHVTTVRPRVN